jgi:Predicted transcriptional regulator
MESVNKREKNTHHGHAVRRIRNSMGIKQEALATDMGITQSLVSFYEQKKEIESDMIEKFARALNVSSELIKELEEDPLTIIIENNTFENNQKVSNIGNYIVEDSSVNHFDPVDKIVELFEKLLEKEQEKIALLEKLLKDKK